MQITFYEYPNMKETSFAKNIKSNDFDIYIGTDETRTKDELIKDLKELFKIK